MLRGGIPNEWVGSSSMKRSLSIARNCSVSRCAGGGSNCLLTILAGYRGRDPRFRLSFSRDLPDRRFAIQGTFTISHSSGFLRDRLGSLIRTIMSQTGDAEVDLIAGYKKAFKSTARRRRGCSIIIILFGLCATRLCGALCPPDPGAWTGLTDGSGGLRTKEKALTVDGIHSEDNLYSLPGTDFAYAVFQDSGSV